MQLLRLLHYISLLQTRVISSTLSSSLGHPITKWKSRCLGALWSEKFLETEANKSD